MSPTWSADPIVTFDNVSVTYPGRAEPTIREVTIEVREGELLLVVGRTGTGKSTLLGAINGLVPHFTGGSLAGRVTVAGRDTRTHPPRELADVVGVVPQNPLDGFVTDSVEEELAYCMESLGLPQPVMRRRVEETLDLLGLADLRDRPLQSLSGGQRQRVAIGSVLTAHPRVLVLDEPTSALDPGAAEEVLAALQRLVHDLGLTVIMAEHRLERVIQYADRIAVLPGRGDPLRLGEPREMMRDSPVAPPVVQLGRVARWEPLPLSIREARRWAPGLRRALAGRSPTRAAGPATPGRTGMPPAVAEVAGLTVRYGPVFALQGLDLSIAAGEVVALMGRNGAGKSTLLSALTGMLAPSGGTVRLRGADPARLAGRELIGRVGLVPQEAADLLAAESVGAECRAADADAQAVAGTCAALLARIAPDVPPNAHPRDLSEGQRLSLALAVILTAGPPLLLLDEPTRGLDYDSKGALVAILRELRADGTAVVVATHDVELAADVATRVVILSDGECVAEGPADEVVVSSPLFAPQVAKILGDGGWLTVAQVGAALAPAVVAP